MGDSPSGSSGDLGRTTLADKLIASSSGGGQVVLIEASKLKEMPEDQLHEVFKRMDKAERECFDRIGRRFNTMLEAVREAKNVAKPVQAAIAEAMTAYKQATGARKQRRQVEEHLRTRTKKELASVAAAENTCTDANILAEVKRISSKLAEHGDKIDSIATKLASDQAALTQWTEVVRRKPLATKDNQSVTEGNIQDGKVAWKAKAANPKPVEVRKKQLRARQAAIVVDITNQDDFPELIKKIRSGVNSEVIGEHVVGMRKTKPGRLLLEVKGDSGEVEAVRAEVLKSTGGVNVVRTLEQRTMLEVRDLDEWTDEEEVAKAVAAATGASRDTVKVISLRKAYESSQISLVLAPTALCRNVVSHGRLRVGLVNCRIRQGEQKTRCFRCLSFGHMAGQCQGPDRGQCCRRCGVSGHKAAHCGATNAAAKEFAEQLEVNGPNQAEATVTLNMESTGPNDD